MKKLITIFLFAFLSNANAQGLKIAVGNFDFSDDGMRSSMLELNYDFGQKEKYGILKPTTGAFITQDSASYAFIGGKVDFKLGPFILSMKPSSIVRDPFARVLDFGSIKIAFINVVLDIFVFVFK